jgi:hypothetical protein
MTQRTGTSGRRFLPASALGLGLAYLVVVIAGSLEVGASSAHAGDDTGMVITIVRTRVLNPAPYRDPKKRPGLRRTVVSDVYVDGKEQPGHAYENYDTLIQGDRSYNVAIEDSSPDMGFAIGPGGVMGVDGDFYPHIMGARNRKTGDLMPNVYFHGGVSAWNSDGCICFGAVDPDTRVAPPFLLDLRSWYYDNNDEPDYQRNRKKIKLIVIDAFVDPTPQ